MAPAPVGSAGTPVYSAASPVDPTTLTPGTGSGYAIGDVILCFTANALTKTASAATPAGWTKIVDAPGTGNCRMYLFAKVAASTTEAAPSVVWSSLGATGASGDPCMAMCRAFTGLDTSDLTTLAEVVGTPNQGGTSAVNSKAGASITTAIDDDLVLSLSVRADDIANTWTLTGFTNVSGGAGSGASMFTTSGRDGAAQWAYQVKTPAGLVASADFALSGGTITSQVSLGVYVALKATPVASVPVNTVAPVISGTRVVGQTLSTTDGTWTNTPTSFAYQWQRDGSSIGSATSSTYLLVTADADHVVTCLVTATNASGDSTPAASNSLAIVAEIIAADIQFWTSSAGIGGSPGAAVTDPTVVFDSVTNSEAIAGDVEYRAVYLKNTHAVRALTTTLTWISSQTTSLGTDIALDVAPEAAGSDVTSIANESVPPVGVSFTAPSTEGTGIAVGTLAAGQARGIWLRRTVTAGAAATPVDTCTLSWSGTPA